MSSSASTLYTKDYIDSLEHDLLRIHRERIHPVEPVELERLRESTRKQIGQLHAELPPGVGDVLAKARLVEEIASGEFGTVWKARLDHDGTVCAVKVFHPHRLESGTAIREFRLGVLAMETLTNAGPPPSIVRLIADDRARLAFSMTYVDGRNLRNISSRGWRPEKKLDIFVQLCWAVKFAHDHGVLHRDLKPENVVIDETTGQPVLTDFDLADILTQKTLTSHSTGTLAYAAPEQLEPPDERQSRLKESDIYSLGRLLLFLLTERDPSGIFRQPVPLLGEIANFPGLDRIIRRCTLADPELRYGSVQELLADVDRFLSGNVENVGVGSNDAPQARHTLHGVERVPESASNRRPAFLRSVGGGAGLAAILASLIGGGFVLKGSSITADATIKAAEIQSSIRPATQPVPTQLRSPASSSSEPRRPESPTGTAESQSPPCSASRAPEYVQGTGSLQVARIELKSPGAETTAADKEQALRQFLLGQKESMWAQQLIKYRAIEDGKQVYRVVLNAVSPRVNDAMCAWLGCRSLSTDCHMVGGDESPEMKCARGGPSVCYKQAKRLSATQPARAALLHESACAGGNKWACNNLADMYYQGQIGYDMTKAVRLFRRACDLGNGKACGSVQRLQSTSAI
jgi:serine/threonine protein kinase